MYELNQVGAQSYYINCPAKIGIYKQNETDVYLIDSGNDKDAGRKVRKILDENGWKLKGIINTHSNADHIGGNRYLQNQTGCKIFAKGIELEVIDLKGHFFDMIGIRTPDNTVFLADCISSEFTLEKYQISFIYDVSQYLNTLDKVEKLEANIFVPAHAQATEDIKELTQLNRNKVLEIADKIENALTTSMCFEALLKKIFDDYNLTMNFEQYVLVGSTVKSYLSYLKDNGKITAQFKDNQLLWEKV